MTTKAKSLEGGQKRCTTCQEIKPLEAYYALRRGIAYECKVCYCARSRRNREANLEKYRRTDREYREKNRDYIAARNAEWREANPLKYRLSKVPSTYGISVETYLRMHEEQRGLCAICLQPESRKRHMLSVDHNHVTGEVRALLCSNCNAGIGMLKDSADVVRAALDYLEKHGAKQEQVIRLVPGTSGSRARKGKGVEGQETAAIGRAA